ncbi:MAG TPA: response regulator [Myxococcota bacterium]
MDPRVAFVDGGGNRRWESDVAESLPAPIRVVVVDDDRLVRLLVGEALKGAGLVVEEGDSGATALRLAQSVPDVVVIDVNLPDLSGLNVCRALRANERTADIGIVFLTGAEDARTVVGAFNVGADDCLHKPVVPEILVARVQRAAAHAAARAAARVTRQRLAACRTALSSGTSGTPTATLDAVRAALG